MKDNRRSNIEYEVRVLDIDIYKVNKKILELGGKKNASYLFRRYVFDVIPKREGEWIRLRTDGKTSTLTFKSIKNDNLDGTLEWEVKVDDFDKTFEILKNAGFQPKGYQENKRTEYALDGNELSIDEWPLIPPYLEVEGASKNKVTSLLTKLGYNKYTGENVQKIYKKHGIDIDKIAELKFS